MNISEMTTDEITKKIGERLKARRLSMGLSCEDLALWTMSSPLSIKRAESGVVSLKGLIAMLAAMEMLDEITPLLTPEVTDL